MKFIRNPEEVAAIQWLPETHEKVMSWAAGAAYYEPFSDTLEVVVNGKLKRARSGDYLVKDSGGMVDVVSQNDFQGTFTPIQHNESTN